MNPMLKRSTIIGLLAALLLALVACGGGAQSQVLAPPVVDSPGPAPEAASGAAPQSQAEAPAEAAKVYLNGNRLSLTGQAESSNGDVLVPAAEVLSYFSRTITASYASGTLTIQDPDMGNTLEIKGGEASATLNGSAYALAQAPKDTGSDLLVDAASLGALFDAQTSCNDDATTVYITESGLC